jgi:hypothetical protein
MGFTVDGSRGENSGLSIVLRHKSGTLEGGVDPRREGVIGEENKMQMGTCLHFSVRLIDQSFRSSL